MLGPTEKKEKRFHTFVFCLSNLKGHLKKNPITKPEGGGGGLGSAPATLWRLGGQRKKVGVIYIYIDSEWFKMDDIEEKWLGSKKYFKTKK